MLALVREPFRRRAAICAEAESLVSRHAAA